MFCVLCFVFVFVFVCARCTFTFRCWLLFFLCLPQPSRHVRVPMEVGQARSRLGFVDDTVNTRDLLQSTSQLAFGGRGIVHDDLPSSMAHTQAKQHRLNIKYQRLKQQENRIRDVYRAEEEAMWRNQARRTKAKAAVKLQCVSESGEAVLYVHVHWSFTTVCVCVCVCVFAVCVLAVCCAAWRCWR